ncbi:MAG: DUF5930 domain-containing protein [Pseudomonadota bacterium]
MTVGRQEGWRARIARAFCEKCIYVKCADRVRHISLSSSAQKGIAVAGLIGLVWIAYASTSLLQRSIEGQSVAMRLDAMREAYLARIAAMEEDQHILAQRLARASSRAQTSTARYSDLQRRLVQSESRVAAADMELASLNAELQRVSQERKSELEMLAAREQEVVALSLALADAQNTGTTLAASVKTVGQAMRKVIAERDGAREEAHRVGIQMAAIESELELITDRQEVLLAQLETAARLSIEGLGNMFSRAKLDMEAILSQTRRAEMGSGGPLQPVPVEELQTQTDLRIAALITDLERINLMRFAAQRIPLARPVGTGRYTSGFGRRRDPFTRQLSMHSGLDIAAPRGTPIYATADGVVTFSGRQSGYGITVKIRHAFGFETLYAHLNRAHVNVGDRVDRGHHIADMGSTGRSTGSHLHYEVRVDRQPVNPMRFIEAARDVL